MKDYDEWMAEEMKHPYPPDVQDAWKASRAKTLKPFEELLSEIEGQLKFIIPEDRWRLEIVINDLKEAIEKGSAE